MQPHCGDRRQRAASGRLLGRTAPGVPQMTNANAEVGRMVRAGSIDTNLHDVGAGKPVLLVHGSGPGVTAWANWRTVMPELSRRRRVIAPDMVGFGFTERPQGIRYGVDTLVVHLVGIFDAMELDRHDFVGN